MRKDRGTLGYFIAVILFGVIVVLSCAGIDVSVKTRLHDNVIKNIISEKEIVEYSWEYAENYTEDGKTRYHIKIYLDDYEEEYIARFEGGQWIYVKK